MLVSKKKQALILRPRDPDRILALIPKAKKLQINGKTFVAVKHDVDEVKVLRNIGIVAPSPIKYHYDWPGQFKPFLAQRDTADFLTTFNRAFCLNDMGTGKTLATLWAYDFLRKQGIVKKALVISPLSTLERTWADEVFTHFPYLDVSVLYGTREKRLAMLEQDADIYLINHDGIKVSGLVEAFASRPDIDLIVVDEIAQMARNSGTDRFRAINTIINKQTPRRAWGLTGTPTPNAPTDAWAQCRLLVPEKAPLYFSRFRDMVMKQVGMHTWLPRSDAQAIVFSIMQPSIRFTRDECVDLPPCLYETRSVELTAEQKKAYREMLNRLKTEVDNGTVTAVNEAVKAQKLIQIACGVVYDENRVALEMDVASRLKVIEEIVDEAGTKVIVFVPFVAVVERVAEYLRDAGQTVEVIHGGVSKNERDRIIGAFQKSPTPKVLVAQPAAMSHGLTLTAASTIIWYAPITSNDTFEQANARVTRPGQKHTQLIVMVEGTDIERKYYKRLKDKQKVQGVLLDMVQSDRHMVA